MHDRARDEIVKLGRLVKETGAKLDYDPRCSRCVRAAFAFCSLIQARPMTSLSIPRITCYDHLSIRHRNDWSWPNGKRHAFSAAGR